VEEIRLLMGRQLRVTLAQQLGQATPAWVGQTLEAVIADERKYRDDAKAKEAEAAKLAAEAKSAAEAKQAELRKAINLTVFEKGFIPSNPSAGRYSDYLTFKTAYENTSGKDIRAFRGAVRFADLFGQAIISVNLTIQDPIAAGQKATWSGTIEYNQFLDTHKKLQNHELQNMKVTWLPESIIFTDGTQIGEQQP
jgi:hypothetical protein